MIIEAQLPKWKQFEGEVGELYGVKYLPSWANRYPDWLVKILCYLLNHSPFLRRFEKFL
jgi:hypothetical protein